MKYFTKKWYLNGCVDTPNIEDSHYYDMDTGIHDLKIVNTVKEKDHITQCPFFITIGHGRSPSLSLKTKF